MSKSLKEQATNGVIWSAIERFSVQGIQFVLSIIIARLVSPSEYGLIAMLGIFIAIAQIFVDSGFSNALIQKKDRTETDFSTVFYFNIVISLIVYLLLFACSHLIADFYNEPRLDIVTKWVGLTLIISGLTIVQRAKLTINLDFKTQAKASLIGVIIGGVVGVTMAYYGYGVWALVVQTLTSGIINSTFLWIFAKWHPCLEFSLESFKVLFSFGSKLLIGGLLHTIYLNLYSLVIGRQYSAANVGFYNRANSFVSFPSTNIVGILTRATYPLLCQLQDDDDKLVSAFSKSLRMCCYIIAPLLIGLSVLAKPLIIIILTDKWLPAAELLSILSIAYLFYPMMSMNWQLLSIKGRTDYSLRSEIIKKIIAIIILASTISFGVKVLCLGILLYNIIDFFIIMIFVKKVLPGIGYRSQFQLLIIPYLFSALMGVAVYAFTLLFNDKPHLQLLLGIPVGAIVYGGLSYLFKIDEFIIGLNMFRRLIKNRILIQK